MKNRYTIIGNSAAAIGAVESIRQVDRESGITLIASEPHHTYSRPLISYWLGGEVGDERMPYRDAGFYEENGVDTMLAVEVTSVDPENRVLTTSDGEEVPFEKLLIATGGTPIVPPDVRGADAEGVFTFTTWDDARAIEAYIEEHGVEKALVVGAGLIGLKSTEALAARGIEVTVVELADRVLSATFDQTASRLAREAMEKAGVRTVCENTVGSVHAEEGRVCGVTLQDGPEVDVELLLFAIGVRPNTALVRNSSIQVDRGILVDDQMETSVAGIYAAGDVAQARQLLSEERRTLPILPTAYRQGSVAGSNMAGESRTYEGGVPMNSVDVFGLPTISVGMTNPDREDAECITRHDEDEGTYKKLVLQNDRIVGAIFIGDIERAGIFTGLIKEKVDVADFKDVLLSDDFGLLSLPADYRKHVVSGLGMEV